MTALDHLLKLHEEDGKLDRKTEVQFNNIIGILREKMPAHRGNVFTIIQLADKFSHI